MPSHAAVVTEIEELAPSVLQITIAFADDMFRFQPGQWVNFRFPEGVSRAYTIASAPQRPQAVQLCVRVGAGKGGEALKRLEAGAAVRVEGPYGDFVLPDDVKLLAVPVLAHRLGMRGRGKAADMLSAVVTSLPIPPLRQH